MSELNREKIMKGLECCASYDRDASCGECPYMYAELADNEICSNRMAEDALALIKELTEENERLTKTNLIFARNVETVAANYYKLGCTDTVRKMQERLNEAFKHYPQRCGDCCKEKVDQIAKEMLEGE
jgi:hypothetical protein